MDSADCDEAQLLRTVKQFRLINRLFSNTRAALRRYVLDDAPGRFSIIDVGAGGGDIMQWLVAACRRRRVDVSVTCIDADPRIAAYARTASASYPEITVRCATLEAVGDTERYDYVFANHLLHHYPDAAIPKTLSALSRMGKRRLIVSDIYRSRAAHTLFGLFAAFFCHNSFARFDGMLSIRKGFIPSELEAFAKAAGIDDRTTIVKQQPARLIMVCEAE